MTEFREYPWDLRDDEWPWQVTIHAADQVVGACVSLEQELTLMLAACPDYDMAKAQGRCVKVWLVPMKQTMPRGDWVFVCMTRLRLPGKTGTYPVALFYRPVSERPVILELPQLPSVPPLASAGASASSPSASPSSVASVRAQSPAERMSSGASPSQLPQSSRGGSPTPVGRSIVPLASPVEAPRGR